MASTISTARQNLYALLAAHHWPGEQPQVVYGYPLGYEEQEVVALGGVEDASEDPAALGGQRHEETYVLLVEIKVYDAAGDADEVDRRGWQLADEVRSVVNTTTEGDRNLRGAVRWARIGAQVSPGAVPAQSGPESAAEGWVIFITVRVVCAERIT